ncbi:lipoyl(octanoyl) transferase LipB [Actinokineospora globicatena]|uniref:lipoyl(octanoyl) transferase LipB n=1 Tax=Actinokineospora globicatena TaxID=103729 RepID=UPI0020A3F315|nr:lipoyl(octanoyl) transferase LipB [Actinokineospora globicatena]MCP2305401.1 lipoyl(octanoyl) transferase [Actinokineospora globicatena]
MSTLSCRAATHPVSVREVGTIDYHEAWALQRDLVDARAEGTGEDTLLLLEHPSVYTAGKRTLPEERPTNGTEVVDTDRGGKITWHGPGQLVGYPIVALSDPVDVVDYVRRLEEAMIAMCAQLGLTTGRVEGRSGVWLAATATRPERKIGAIGIRVQRGVTLHGFQINCDADLTAFDTIVPCGIKDAGVTSLSEELGRQVTVAEVLELAKTAIPAALDGTLPVTEHWIPRTTTPTTPGVTFALSTQA